MTDKKAAWFPAKENGWGWGKPTSWQGWGVIVGYLLSIALVSFWVDPKVDVLTWVGWVSVCTLALIGMYVWKGESPNWKWKTIEKEKRKWFK